MKVAAVFIIYNPNVHELTTNILKIVNHVDKVLLWFNSEAGLDLPSIYAEKIIRLSGYGNEFISKPLNKVLNYCELNEIDFLLTMDQDSEWDDLSGFLNYIKNNPISDAVVYTPNINSGRKEVGDVVEVETVITSGSLHDVKKTLKLGGFREDYEIYWVDGEFSYWARQNDYRLYCLPKFTLKHQFGGSTKKVLGFRGANYSAKVYYYLFRNMLWMHREYGVKAVSYKTILYQMKLFIPGIILCEKNKLDKIKSIIRAFYEGFFYKFSTRVK